MLLAFIIFGVTQYKDSDGTKLSALDGSGEGTTWNQGERWCYFRAIKFSCL